MKGFTVRDRRALWIGALLVGPLLAWRVLVMPLASAHATHAAKAELAAGLLARERALLRDGPLLRARLESARGQLRAEPASHFIAADTVAAARALIAALRSAASESGLVDVGVENGPPRAVGGLIEVQADVRARGTTAAVTSWLARLEADGRVLPVDRLDLFPDGADRLAMRARVRGFARQAAP
jgi:hypothetical protein